MDNAARPVVFVSSPEAGLMNVLLLRARAGKTLAASGFGGLVA